MNVQVKPRFEVHKLDGTGVRRIASPKVKLDDKGKPKLDDKGNSILLGGFEYEDKEVDAGWMVYFPNGSSIRVWTKEEMERQGFLSEVTLVNMETGDDMGPATNTSLKSRSEQKEVVTKSSKVHHVTT
jgi:hypothetical protein